MIIPTLKRLCFAAGCLLLAQPQVQAQTVNFGNKDAGKGINAPIYLDAVGGIKLDGAAYMAQLYFGAVGAAEETLRPAGDPVSFRTALRRGMFRVLL